MLQSSYGWQANFTSPNARYARGFGWQAASVNDTQGCPAEARSAKADGKHARFELRVASQSLAQPVTRLHSSPCSISLKTDS